MVSAMMVDSYMNEDSFVELVQQMKQLIIDSIKEYQEEKGCAPDEAFEEIFFGSGKHNDIRDDILSKGDVLNIDQFSLLYAESLLNGHSEYLTGLEESETVHERIKKLTEKKFKVGQNYHMINQKASVSHVFASIKSARGFEREIQLSVNCFLDEDLAYHKNFDSLSRKHKLDLDIKILLQPDSEKVVIEFYDMHNAEFSLDADQWNNEKVPYCKIGRTEVALDEIIEKSLSNNQYKCTKEILLTTATAGKHSGVDILSSPNQGGE